MSGNKTVENESSVTDFLHAVENEQRKKDSFKALEMLNEITGLQPKMWGNSIVGYGSYHYKYESGREGDFFKVGFSPRKNSMTFYIIPGFPKYSDLLEKLGKYKTGKSCLYIKQLDTIDLDALKEIIAKSFAEMNEKYPQNG